MTESGKRMRNLIVSVVLAVAIALSFYIGATQVGGSEGVDLIGGTIYSFVLSLIVFLTFVPRALARLSQRAITDSS